MVKITRLTSFNIAALRETLTAEELADVTIGRTVAEFAMSGPDAVALVEKAQSRAGAVSGTQGHPYQSLHAVIRKLRAKG